MLNKLAALLREKSEQLNLFSKGDREKLESKHIPDSLAVEDFWEPETGQLVMDIGTGGGLPGLALAVNHPEMRFVLVDARQKKIAAVQDTADSLGLDHVSTAAERFEVLAHDPDYREMADIVTARAVANLATLLEYASGFLKEGGLFYAWKSEDYEEELEASRAAQAVLNLEFEDAFPYTLAEGEKRVLLRFKKTAPLDEGYPRSIGKAKAKPL